MRTKTQRSREQNGMRGGDGRRRFATIAQPAERAFLCHAQYQAAEEARPNRHS
jgi:hypothetical protein